MCQWATAANGRRQTGTVKEIDYYYQLKAIRDGENRARNDNITFDDPLLIHRGLWVVPWLAWHRGRTRLEHSDMRFDRNGGVCQLRTFLAPLFSPGWLASWLVAVMTTPNSYTILLCSSNRLSCALLSLCVDAPPAITNQQQQQQ